MATSHDYFLAFKAARNGIARLLGVDPELCPADMLRLADADLTASAMLAKALVDKGVLTDTDVQLAMTSARSGADGSVWREPVPAPGSAVWEDMHFTGEEFEVGAAGADATDANTRFSGGQVGSSLLPAFGTVKFDDVTYLNGSKSLHTWTTAGYSRALRSATYETASEVYAEFFFRAAAAPGTGGGSIFAFQLNPANDTSTDADVWCLEVSVDSAGHPTMFDSGVERAPGSTPPSICDGNWWRVEVGIYGITCECRLFGGTQLQSNTATFSWTGTYSANPANCALVGQPRSALTSAQSWDTWYDDVRFATSGWVGY